MKLVFYIRMPVMISRKHPDLVGAAAIANGVTGTIVGVHPAPQLLQSASGFPEGVIGLPPLKIGVRLRHITNLSQSSVTVHQFAVVPAFACTTEKLQGKTCEDGIVVTPLDRRSRGTPYQTLYVALTRAVCLDGLVLTEPITRTYLAKFQLTEVIVSEMQRLVDFVKVPDYISAAEANAFNLWKARQRPSHD
ncbi:unnamed protein product [Phytophthora lilii]|uniref:Unnamed protein product n=1 Tax=Phytophthora lilii TaxID=2077276 RepID=A0A9W6X4W5_9STRA|nr:unnamed protein product [Phytophthora lilii]